ncbi:putative carbohydrate esterase At4g34215 [Primulina tabacum]|uniref:putative carbohydrate esterase At4g34215 n=1 Tax=Primulina tabacum TaxID=48773 RepID=UPI003F5A680A
MGENLSFLAIYFLLLSLLSANEDKSIFILAGQSNMSGRARDYNNTKPPEFHPNPQILMFDANQRWVMAKDPLHLGIDVGRPVGFGPGIPFANALLEWDPCIGTIGLVPCAHGETFLSDWSKGTPDYNQLVMRANASSEAGGRIRAMLWYQGENDSLTRQNAQLYGGRLEKFITDFRADIGMPDLPVFVVVLASGLGKYKDMIREAQMGIKLRNVISVDGKGAEVKPLDVVHISLAGAIDIGKRLASAFLYANL